MSKLLRKGSKGEEVKALQTKLQQLGYKIEADGIFGGGTEEAVIALQKAFGYTVDGLVGEGTTKLVDAQIGYGWNVNKEGAAETAAKAASSAQKSAKGGDSKKG
jgi:peptidoglycan hydrolase-like protein with peptidoglycan-binding domain